MFFSPVFVVSREELSKTLVPERILCSFYHFGIRVKITSEQEFSSIW